MRRFKYQMDRYLTEDSEGEWVRYNDAQNAVFTLRKQRDAQIHLLQKEVMFWKSEVMRLYRLQPDESAFLSIDQTGLV